MVLPLHAEEDVSSISLNDVFNSISIYCYEEVYVGNYHRALVDGVQAHDGDVKRHHGGLA